MIRRYKNFIIVVAGIGISILLTLPVKGEEGQINSPDDHRQVLAKVLKIVGKAQYKRIDSENWKDAQVGDELTEKMEIRTGIRSSVLLRLQKSAIVQVKSLTRMAITELKSYENTEKTTVFLRYGTVRAGVVPVGIKSDFKIATPTAVLTREGTWGIEFTYDPSTGNFTAGLDTEGLIRVINNLTGKRRRLYPGQFTTQEMLMWVESAKFRRMTSLIDKFGSTDIEKLFFKNNGNGRTGTDFTGSNIIPNYVLYNLQQTLVTGGIYNPDYPTGP